MSADPRIQYKIMLPASLKERLENAAYDNRRSLSAEIIARLETTLEMDDYRPGPNVHADETALDLAKALVKRLKQQK